jgi:2-dehydro-3-deoxyphosphogluconate aldolase/(4S)-4-hydroxy-2-oxoglutarate aldolase
VTSQDSDVSAALERARLVPVVVLDDAASAGPLADALVAGGLPVAEVTFRTPAAGDAPRAMADRGDLLLGAGTVLTPAQVDEAAAAGASHVVSPGLSRAVVERCAEHGVLALPGAVPATEVQAALELGLTTLEFFPAGTWGGAPAIAALAAPFAGVRFIPTGGIGPTDLAQVPAHRRGRRGRRLLDGAPRPDRVRGLRGRLTAEAVAAVQADQARGPDTSSNEEGGRRP